MNSPVKVQADDLQTDHRHEADISRRDQLLMISYTWRMS